MSIDQTRRSINQLDKDLATLEKKFTEELKKEASENKKINTIEKSITKNISASRLKTKLGQIQHCKDELLKVSNAKKDINNKIADKRKKRGDLALKLQKEEMAKNKKIEKAQKRIQDSYKKQISDLTSQLASQIASAPPVANTIPTSKFYANDETEYDVFLSHASEDKESFADEFYEELKNNGINVWYDALSMSWGDSLRSKIDNGLSKSKFGIVILSNAYIKKGWTNYELDGLFQREMSGGKVILPIWHNITKQEVEKFSPTLAGRLALTTATMTAKEITEELKKILNSNSEGTEETEND